MRKHERFMIAGHPQAKIICGKETIEATLLDVSVNGLGIMVSDDAKLEKDTLLIELGGRRYRFSVRYRIALDVGIDRVGLQRKSKNLLRILKNHLISIGY